MTQPKLHLDMDTSRRGVVRALLEKKHDVTRTPNPELDQDASDEIQLFWAMAHQRIIFTFNVKDFIILAKKYPYHNGILLANQKSFTTAQLIGLLNRALSETSAKEWVGNVRWLNDWNV